MFKKDIDKVKELHQKYRFERPLLDAGGLSTPLIADYDVSVRKAYRLTIECEGVSRAVAIPHNFQDDRYLKISRPWSFIDEDYLILNPANGDPAIEQLPHTFRNHFSTVILVSVFEHVANPYDVSDALFEIVKPGGYLFNSAPFIFPYHPSPEDNFRYSPVSLKRIHEKSGFKWLEGDFHLKYSSNDGVGDTNRGNYLAPTSIWACYALCRKV